MKRTRTPGEPKPKKRIKSSSAKAKARVLQQWACQMISDLLGIPWGKDELIASREMGQSGTDVRLIGAALKEFPYSVECKNQETWSVSSWIKQTQSNQAPGTDWLLIMKKNHTDPVVVMDAKKFFELLRGR